MPFPSGSLGCAIGGLGLGWPGDPALAYPTGPGFTSSGPTYLLSFDNVASPLGPWGQDSGFGGLHPGTLVTGRRPGTLGWKYGFASGSLYLRFTTSPTVTAGFAFKTMNCDVVVSFADAPPPLGASNSILDLHLVSINDGRFYVEKRQATGGGFTFVKTTGPFMHMNGIWHYLEMAAIFSGGNFLSIVALDGEVILKHTMPVGSIPYGGISTVYFQGPGGGDNSTLDDIYVDLTGQMWGDMFVNSDDLTFQSGTTNRVSQFGIEVVGGVAPAGGGNYVSSGGLVTLGNYVS